MTSNKGILSTMLMIVVAFIAISNAQLNGDRVFYAKTLFVNQNYGPGAAFRVDMWCKNTPNTVTPAESRQFLRLDYIDNSNVTYMQEVFNYVSNDKYQICNTGGQRKCERSRYVAPQPFFFVPSDATHTLLADPPAITYQALQVCGAGSTAYEINENEALQARFLVFKQDGTLCRIIMSNLGSNEQFEGEFLVQNYFTTGGTLDDPQADETYEATYGVADCPEPTCFAELDLTLVIDESGSMANNQLTVGNFTLDLINRLSVSQQGVRIGVVYFSGIDCQSDFNGQAVVDCTGGCERCGGRYNVTYQGLSGNLDFVTQVVTNHQLAGGFTCLECGITKGAESFEFAGGRDDVPNAMIVVTDAVQNRRTALLEQAAALNFQRDITTYAVAIGEQLGTEELRIITGSDDRIFTVNNFESLIGSINDIVLPLCQSLPDVDTCESCAGLCRCGDFCQCPNSCDDSNVCTTPTCDATGTGGLCVQNAVSCDDNNACTTDSCDPVLGCSNIQERPSNIPADNLCTVYRCNPSSGVYVAEDVGDANCGPIPGDLCRVRFCNSSTGQCGFVDKNDITAGEQVTFLDSSNSNRIVNGCGKPNGSLSCIVYGCDADTGDCTVENTCECTSDAGCNDQDGCTVDTCNSEGKCVRTRIDCLDELSMGRCVAELNGDYDFDSADTVNTVRSFIEGTTIAAFATNGSTLNPSNGVSRSCGELACFLGQPSDYQCVSNDDNLHTCTRFVKEVCTSNGCINDLCTPSTGNALENGQIPSSCVEEDFTCPSSTNPECQAFFCDASAPAFPESGRCTLRNNVFCNDNDACTNDACVNGTGCVYTPIDQPMDMQNTSCVDFECRAGNFFPILPGKCQSSGTDRCMIDFCSNNTCEVIDKASQSGLITLTNAIGNEFTVQGCGKPDNASIPACLIYGCNNVTGACTISSSNCSCSVANQAIDCDDQNGCTMDTCDAATFECVYTPVDCLSAVSNGRCTTNSTGFDLNTDVSINFLYGNGSSNFDLINGNQPTTGVNRTCEELACFNGQPSDYQCVSNNNAPICIRNVVDTCVSTGCQDRLCTITAGDLVDNQFQTTCEDGASPDCPNTFCTTRSCNIAAVGQPLAERCTSVDNNRCEDGNDCFTNICDDNNNTCIDTPIVPSATFTCFDQVCNNGVFSNVSKAGVCTNADQCVITYCDPASDSCQFVNKTTLVRGTTETFVNNFGETVTVSGCATPADALGCEVFGCDSDTGLCTIDTSKCVCRTDADCNDLNGCTLNRCTDGGKTCTSEPFDCYDFLSGGNCQINGDYTASQTVGRFFASNPSVISDVIGNPDSIFDTPITGVNRTCNDLACFNGQRSRYFCESLSSGERRCLRSPVNCFAQEGCGSEFCETLGGWFNGQIRTNCFQEDVFCNDNNPCTIDRCNANYNPFIPSQAERCVFEDIKAAVVCNDGDSCTVDTCNPCLTTGIIQPFCEHTVISGAALEAKCPNKTCETATCSNSRCSYSDIVCPNPTACGGFACNPLSNECEAVVALGFDTEQCIKQLNSNGTVLPTTEPTGPFYSVCAYNDKACVQNPVCSKGSFGVCTAPFNTAQNRQYFIVFQSGEDARTVRFYSNPLCNGEFTTEVADLALGQCGIVDDISFRFAGSASTIAVSFFVVLATILSLLL